MNLRYLIFTLLLLLTAFLTYSTNLPNNIAQVFSIFNPYETVFSKKIVLHKNTNSYYFNIKKFGYYTIQFKFKNSINIKNQKELFILKYKIKSNNKILIEKRIINYNQALYDMNNIRNLKYLILDEFSIPLKYRNNLNIVFEFENKILPLKNNIIYFQIRKGGFIK